MIDDLKMIKKFYGEKMMHLCKELFPTILEYPGVLYSFLNSYFYHSRSLYDDICKSELVLEFKEYIYTLVGEEEVAKKIENRTPFELLDEAGYILYECHNEEEIQTFKSYYKPEEQLCTFRGDRLDRCHVFFAVKKNASEIKRENFTSPKRQDEYGTSVISIQFTRGMVNTVSIKNRYNHTVSNPDSTFNNNLDNIIFGLSDSFARYYRFNLKNSRYSFELDGYVRANDGKYYKYNYEINNIYYCPGNIIIDNFEVKNDYLNGGEYIVIDYFILDIPNKKILLYDSSLHDSFIDAIKDISKISVIKKEDNNKVIYIETKSGQDSNVIEICVNIDNKIIGYKNDKIKQTNDSFLANNNALTELSLPALYKVGDRFLYDNKSLTKLNLPSLIQVGDCFLYSNQSLSKLDLPMLSQVRDSFLQSNIKLTKLSLPSLIQVGDRFLYDNESLIELNLPILNKVGERFLYDNESLIELNLPMLSQAGDRFLSMNNSLTKVSLPVLKQVESYFLYYNKTLTELDLPSLIKIGSYFLTLNNSLTKVNLPSLVESGDHFLNNTNSMNEFLRRNL